MPVLPGPRLASRPEVTSTCTPRNGRTKLDGARIQAASLSPEMGSVVDNRITLKTVQRGTPTVSSGRKAAVLGATWQAPRTPPGSQSGACMQRGSLGTWESHRSPCIYPGEGDRATKGTWRDWAAFTRPRARRGHHERNGSRQGIGKRAPSEATCEGQCGSLSGASYRGRWGTARSRERWDWNPPLQKRRVRRHRSEEPRGRSRRPRFPIRERRA